MFYYPGSVQGQRAATLVADGLKTLYPLPNRVRAEPTTSVGEVRRVRAPSVFLELGYHDNADDVFLLFFIGCIVLRILIILLYPVVT